MIHILNIMMAVSAKQDERHPLIATT